MAYRQVQLLAVVAAVACLAPLASATEFMVGDGLGWRARFNETHWADNKTFVVGDSLSTQDRDTIDNTITMNTHTHYTYFVGIT